MPTLTNENEESAEEKVVAAVENTKAAEVNVKPAVAKIAKSAVEYMQAAELKVWPVMEDVKFAVVTKSLAEKDEKARLADDQEVPTAATGNSAAAHASMNLEMEDMDEALRNALLLSMQEIDDRAPVPM